MNTIPDPNALYCLGCGTRMEESDPLHAFKDCAKVFKTRQLRKDHLELIRSKKNLEGFLRIKELLVPTREFMEEKIEVINHILGLVEARMTEVGISIPEYTEEQLRGYRPSEPDIDTRPPTTIG